MTLVILIAFGISAIIGMPIIKFLAKLKFGQKILEIGPKWHMNKQYTPTMGGIIFILSTIITSFVLYLQNGFDIRFVCLLIFSICFGFIGFIDDYTKVAKKQNLGLTALQKLMFQISAAILFITILRQFGMLTPNLYIPFLNIEILMPWILFVALILVAIVGCTNAVNLTDGLDGLAVSVTLPILIFFAMVGVKVENFTVAYFSFILVGALAGFLIFNAYPAKVFMGDTGSLFLGGCVISIALALNLPIMLIFVGIIYILEALSVILQVGFFKISRGKRLFKMAPIHHHFEMCGFSERKICFVFSLITIIMCVIAYNFGLENYFMY